MKKFKLLSILILVCALQVNAQQESSYTQYMYNTIAFNPAYAGSRGTTSLFGLYRNQWLNQVGSPKIGMASIHAPITDRVSLGSTIQNEQEGPVSQSSLNVQFSYNLQFSQNFKLYFGLSGGVGSYNVDLTKLNIYNVNDPSLTSNNSFVPKFGAGFYLMSENEYIGFSVPNLLKSNVYANENVVLQNQIHAYIIAGKVFQISNNLKFKPSVLAKITSGVSPQYDLSANFLYKEKLNLGAIYRWDNAYGFMLGYQINNQLFAGYSIDILTSKLNQYNSGSHEVFVRYELFKKYSKIQSPRFF